MLPNRAPSASGSANEVSAPGLRDRARAAALPVARAALRETAHYRTLVGGGWAREWLAREADVLADAMADAMLASIRHRRLEP